MDVCIVRCCAQQWKYFSRTKRLFNSKKTDDQFSRSIITPISRRLSSKPTTAFRTHEDDPRHHSSDHVGLFYKINQNEMNNVLRQFVVPSQQRLMKTFNESCFMVRKPALELNDYLKQIDYNHPVTKFILYGTLGSGKSSCLLHTVQCCARNDWIIVHVPWGSHWVRSYKKEVADSSYKSGRVDLPADAAEWLSYFRLQNAGKLKDIKTTSEYVWTQREKVMVGTPLEEIIDFGLNRLKFSSDVLGVVLKELRQQAKSSGKKVLVVVEAVNGFFVQHINNYSLRNAEKKVIELDEISLVHNMKKMMAPTWNNGAVVCTVDTPATGLRDTFTPLYLLGKDGFEFFDPFVPILVPEYTDKEVESCLQYYIDRNWIQNPWGKTEDGKKEIAFVSNKNPLSLARVCSSL